MHVYIHTRMNIFCLNASFVYYNCKFAEAENIALIKIFSI